MPAKRLAERNNGTLQARLQQRFAERRLPLLFQNKLLENPRMIDDKGGVQPLTEEEAMRIFLEDGKRIARMVKNYYKGYENTNSELAAYQELAVQIRTNLGKVKLKPLSLAEWTGTVQTVEILNVFGFSYTAAYRLATLANLSELSEYTPFGHHFRVMGYTDLLLMQMPRPNEEMKELTWTAALLHDAGKAAVDWSVLQNPDAISSLPEKDRRVLTEHAEENGCLLLPLVDSLEKPKEQEKLSLVITIIAPHHERFDGKGKYGLKGKNIRLGTRVITVADALDAMTSWRSYRPEPKSLDGAVAEIDSLKGSQFDPEIANLLVELVRDPGTRAPFARIAKSGKRPPNWAR